MRVTLTSVLDIPASVAWQWVSTPALLTYVAAPLQDFEPIDPQAFPAVWSPGRYLVRLRMFGVVPIGTQWIVISVPEAGPARYRLRDDGSGSLVSTWDHWITIDPLEGNRCRYTDEVEIQAGWRTPFVWLFARLFYTHRQRRWQRLVASRFSALTVGAGA